MSVNDHTASNLSTPYAPIALYFHESDSVEYVRKDVPCIYRRIDEILTLVLEMKSREIIGFRLKGFKNFYITELKKNQDFLQSDFLLAVSVLEKAMDMTCSEIFDEAESEARKMAYQNAWNIAKQDQVEFRDLPQVA
jgi:hypothetical protein